jgi:hypothetical protein
VAKCVQGGSGIVMSDQSTRSLAGKLILVSGLSFKHIKNIVGV